MTTRAEELTVRNGLYMGTRFWIPVGMVKDGHLFVKYGRTFRRTGLDLWDLT